MDKKTLVFINNIHKATIGKADKGYVYIYKNIFLWKEEESLMPKDKNYLPPIKKFKLKDLKMFKNLTQLEDEYEGADWWVGRYYFKGEMKYTSISQEDFGFTDKFAEEIGYNPGKYETNGVMIDKTFENTIIFKYEKKDVFSAYLLFYAFTVQEVLSGSIIVNTDRELYDSLDLYRLIKSKKELKVTLSSEDFLQIRDKVLRIT